MTIIWVIGDSEVKVSFVLNLVFAKILFYYAFLLIIDKYFLINAVTFNSVAELSIPLGMPTN